MSIELTQRPYRAMINQPSTLQPLHKYHGKKGIVLEYLSSRTIIDMFFIDGPIVSMQVPINCITYI